MDVLVTGAAGSIGSAVCRRLAAAGIRIRALVLLDEPVEHAWRTVVGDAGDPAAVADAVGDGVDAVVHLAALRSPEMGTPEEVFAGNTRATFVVLEESARRGARRAVIASSYSILGLRFSPHELHPAYFPIDEATPLQVEDPYSLSKQADEATAAMMHRRYGTDVVALRFPYTAGWPELEAMARRCRSDPSVMAPDSWSYLHVDDAAEAVFLALTRPVTGFHPVFLAAPRTMDPRPTAELIAAHHPDAQVRRPIAGHGTPIDTARIERLLDFRATRLLDVPPL
ncbi:NAD-dependent epimerase/dehydratase family protein [Dactylosporangium sp. CA-139066]|uniref:NAD-dependent epimerase/dehydratase family protein n=1 Tax=Dactylosporangium sp. CA-139066 TaxID=3239930 RepID=UPI003D8DFFF7